MLRVLIADDEELARKRLRKLLKPMAARDRLAVVAEAGDGAEVLDQLSDQTVDLLFLDIQMPELDGFDVLEHLPRENRPVVVFTTAYDDYALRAFEANAVDYLLKPISAERLEEAIRRAEKIRAVPEARQHDERRLQQLLDWLERQGHTAPAAPSAEFLRQLSVPHRDRILIIPVTDLVTAEINEGITRLYVLEEAREAPRPRLRQHIVNYTLDQLEANLDPAAFMRVHRSAIVQLNHIRELISWFSGRYKLVLTGGHEVVASRERSKLLKDRLLL